MPHSHRLTAHMFASSHRHLLRHVIKSHPPNAILLLPSSLHPISPSLHTCLLVEKLISRILRVMAVQAQHGGFAGVPAACLPRGNAFAADEVEAQMREYGALLSAAAANNGYNCAAVVSGAQSELTCNGRGGVLASRKRGREVEEQYVSSSSALLPIPGMVKTVMPSPAVDAVAAASRWVESSMTSTSGRPAAAAAESSFADVLVSELYQHNAETDALVRMECERLRAGLEQARKRQCQALVRAATAAAARRLREKETELEAACRRAAELEERLRHAAAESQAWCGLARNNEVVATGLRATLKHLLLRAAPGPAEGFGDSSDPAADDAQSCCFEATKDAPKEDAASSPAGRWACKCCGEREASVLLLPCRHLCLCKACEPKVDACPVCLAAKDASVVALPPTEAW